MKSTKNLTILKTTNTSNSSMFPHEKKIIEKIALVPQIIPIPPTIYPLQNLKSFFKLKKNTKLR